MEATPEPRSTDELEIQTSPTKDWRVMHREHFTATEGVLELVTSFRVSDDIEDLFWAKDSELRG